MSFDAYGSQQKESTGSGNQVDFDALNRDVVEQAGLQKRETLVGIVAGIIDLGTQEQPDAEVKFEGTEEDERRLVAEFPDTYFKDGFDQDTKKPVRLKCWPQKPVQCVTLAIDFPDVIVDKGKHFGDSKPLPLRLYTGGQFYTQGRGMVVGRPTPLRVVNLDKTRKTKKWSLAQNNLLHKMAVAAKIIDPQDVFLPQDIDKLLGKAMQFTAQVYMKPAAGGKEYYTEYLNFVGAVGRGQAIGELPFEPFMVQVNKANEPRAVKEVRSHVLNTIKGASNYEGSILQAEVEALRGKREDAPQEGAQEAPAAKADKPAARAKPAQEPAKKAAAPAPDVDAFDDDIPFAPIGLQEGKLFLHMI